MTLIFLFKQLFLLTSVLFRELLIYFYFIFLTNYDYISGITIIEQSLFYCSPKPAATWNAVSFDGFVFLSFSICLLISPRLPKFKEISDKVIGLSKVPIINGHLKVLIISVSRLSRNKETKILPVFNLFKKFIKNWDD